MAPEISATASLPLPLGLYAPAVRFGDLIFVSGMTPRLNGKLIQAGRITSRSAPVRFREPVELATQNALAAARSLLEPGESLAAAVSMTVYINATLDFIEHSNIADFASGVLALEFSGSVPSRAAVGVASLPGGAAVELSVVFGVKNQRERLIWE